MSHELEIRQDGQGNGYLGWFNGKEWHGNGVINPALATSMAAARLASGVTWTLNARPVSCDGVQVDGWRAISRGTDGATFGMRTTRYSVLQPDFADALFQRIIDDSHGTVRADAIMSLHNGNVTIATLAIGGDEIVKGDVVECYAAAVSDLRGRVANLALVFNAIVCNNTYTGALADERNAWGKIRHTGNVALKVESAGALMTHAIAQKGKMVSTFKELAATPWTQANLDALVTKLYPVAQVGKRQAASIGKELSRVQRAASEGRNVDLAHLASLTGAEVIESILADADADLGRVSLDSLLEETVKVQGRAKRLIQEAYEGGKGASLRAGTAWGAFNAVTDYLSHSRGRTEENRLAASFSPNETLLESVLEIVKLAA